ncbi:Metallo-hydrolase/oxidoreductase [Fomitopsis betulina]|nr:Metallo-hydrolase/oxidoreductase [Fomitopsis betulina]
MLSLAEFIVWIVAVAVLVFVFLPLDSGDSTEKTAFTARRLTRSTFLIVEVDDIYSEHPYIYAKLVPDAHTLLLLDTGCGGASNDRSVPFASLRAFLETVPIAENGGRPLNDGGRMRYVVALSHCHYDHILGVEQFAHDSPVFQSAHAPAFVSRAALPTHSLCADLGIRTPQFASVLVPHNAVLTSASGVSLGVTLLHTPGHTPDEIALWDAQELMLYVGDTVYEWEPIIFPAEGSISVWLSTIDQLVAVVMSSHATENVKINCGHRTASMSALEVLAKAKSFMLDVLADDVEVRWRTWKRGEWHVEYRQEGGQFSVRCPERLVDDARQNQLQRLAAGVRYVPIERQ